MVNSRFHDLLNIPRTTRLDNTIDPNEFLLIVVKALKTLLGHLTHIALITFVSVTGYNLINERLDVFHTPMSSRSGFMPNITSSIFSPAAWAPIIARFIGVLPSHRNCPLCAATSDNDGRAIGC